MKPTDMDDYDSNDPEQFWRRISEEPLPTLDVVRDLVSQRAATDDEALAQRVENKLHRKLLPLSCSTATEYEGREEKRHAAFLHELGPEGLYAWGKENPRGLTPPMVEFASRAGFEWSPDDALIWEDHDDNPRLDIESIGRLAIVSHRASLSIGEDGLRALAKLRGSTTMAFWDDYPVPMSLRVTLPSDEGEQDLLAAVDEVDVDDDDEVLTDSPPDDADVQAVFIRGSRRHYLAFPDALEELLSALQGHAVEVELTVEEQPDTRHDVTPQVLAIVGHLYRAARRLGGPDPSGMLKFAQAMSRREVTVAELDGAAPETLTPEQNLELRAQAGDFDPIGWKLAAVSPETAETLEAVISAHEGWASPREDVPRWCRLRRRHGATRASHRSPRRANALRRC